MKALSDDCEPFISFPPGHLYSSKAGSLRRWYNPPWFSESIPSTPYNPLLLRECFEKAIIKRLMSDVPFGVLLSGGLDSSLVASVVSRHLAETKIARRWGNKRHTFCIGLKVAPKACGHTEGRKVISREEAIMHIKAAVDARKVSGSDIVIVARTDSRQAISLDEALWRVHAFADAGADVLFIDALASIEEMKEFCTISPEVPKMIETTI